MALPATDDFNRASLGSNWTTGYGTWTISASTLLHGSGSSENFVYWNADSFGADHYSQIDWSSVGGGSYGGPCVRASGSGYIAFYASGSEDYLFYSNGNGSDWNEITSGTTGVSASDTMYVSASGSSPSVTVATKVNGGQFYSDQSTAVAYTGAAGACSYADAYLDNFEGDDLGGGGGANVDAATSAASASGVAPTVEGVQSPTVNATTSVAVASAVAPTVSGTSVGTISSTITL